MKKKRRKNPLTRKEAAESLQYGRALLKASNSESSAVGRAFMAGEASGVARATLSHAKVGDALSGSTKLMAKARKVREKIRKNPAKKSPATMIGKQLVQITTTKGVLKPTGRASVWGLENGDVFIQGFFTKVPGGTVKTVDYLHKAKAKREGKKHPERTWRHDFSKERSPLSRTRGGLLMKAGKTPLWEVR